MRLRCILVLCVIACGARPPAPPSDDNDLLSTWRGVIARGRAACEKGRDFDGNPALPSDCEVAAFAYLRVPYPQMPMSIVPEDRSLGIALLRKEVDMLVSLVDGGDTSAGDTFASLVNTLKAYPDLVAASGLDKHDLRGKIASNRDDEGRASRAKCRRGDAAACAEAAWRDPAPNHDPLKPVVALLAAAEARSADRARVVKLLQDTIEPAQDQPDRMLELAQLGCTSGSVELCDVACKRGDLVGCYTGCVDGSARSCEQARTRLRTSNPKLAVAMAGIACERLHDGGACSDLAARAERNDPDVAGGAALVRALRLRGCNDGDADACKKLSAQDRADAAAREAAAKKQEADFLAKVSAGTVPAPPRCSMCMWIAMTDGITSSSGCMWSPSPPHWPCVDEDGKAQLSNPYEDAQEDAPSEQPERTFRDSFEHALQDEENATQTLIKAGPSCDDDDDCCKAQARSSAAGGTLGEKKVPLC